MWQRTSLGILAAATLCSALPAQCWDQHLVVGPPDTTLSGGLALQPLGSTGALQVALGLPRSSAAGGVDSVRVFEGLPGNLVEVADLRSALSSASPGSFGRAIATAQDWLAVGDPLTEIAGTDHFGAVHLYRRGPAGWALSSTLTPPLLGFGPIAYFGAAVALQGDRLVVGAPYNQGATNTSAGAVFIYQRSGAAWTLQQTLIEPTGALGAGYGAALGLDGGVLAVGSPYLLGAGVGALHVYELQASTLFVQVASFSPGSVPGGRFLGSSVAVEGGSIAAGAVGNAVNNERGEVRLYQRTGGGWTQVALFGATGDERGFGHDVAFAGGALHATAKESASARRYELGPSGWALAHQYTTVAGLAGHAPFGARVRAAAGRVVVSDPEGVTVLPRNPVASAALGCDARPTPPTAYWFVGPRFLLDVAGELRLSNPTLELTVQSEAYGPYPVGSGLLFFGTTSASIPLGSAQLCVGGALRRAAIGAPTPGTTATELTLDLQAPGVAQGLQPGTPLHFQYWFRIGGGSHLTNSLVLTFCP